MAKYMRFAALLLLLLSSLSVPSFGQSLTGSKPPFQSVAGDVNEGTLNVHQEIPIMSKPGPIPFSLSLGYDSNMWYINSGAWSRPNFLSQNGIWSIHATPNAKAWRIKSLPSGACYIEEWLYVDNQSVQHPFQEITRIGPSSNGCPTSATVATTDGSGYLLNLTWPTVWTVTDISGNVVSNYGNTLTDTNNNTVTFNFSTNTWTDSLSPAMQVANYNTVTIGNVPLVNQIVYTGGNGSTYYTASYVQEYLATAFNCQGINDFSTTTITGLMSKLTLPDSSTYQFTYEQTPGKTSSYTTGRIASIVLPTGGKITYSYSGVDCTDGTPNIVTKKVYADGVNLTGTWTYSKTGTPASSTTTITSPAPDNNQTIINFAYYQEVLRKVWTGTASGVPLLQVIHCYNYSSATSCGSASGPTIQSQAALAPQALSVLRSFNGGGNDLNVTFYGTTDSQGIRLHLPTEVDSYDFGGASPITRTFTGYGSWSSGTGCSAIGKNILNKPCTTYIRDSNNNSLYVYKLFTYDSNGNLLTKYDYSGSLWLPTSYAHYANGAVHTVQDPNGTVATYSNLACGFFPQSVSSTAVGWTTSAKYDCNGGVVTSVTGPNGATDVTSYTYHDPFWRVTSVQSPWQGGQTTTVTTSYPSPIEKEMVQYVNGTSAIHNTWTVTDGLGRPRHTQTQDATNWDTVSYTYDSNGRLYTKSNPCVSAPDIECTTNLNTYTGYDGLNRVGKVTDGFGGYISYAYTFNDVLTTLGPSPLYSKQYQHDALGRLASVCEVSSQSGSGACGQSTSATGFLTSYGYDAAGRLLNINQHGEQRNFQYDLVGRLNQESHPESGTKSYFYDVATGNCTGWAHKGDIVEADDAAGDVTCFNYDGLHRLQAAGNPNVTGAVMHWYAYDWTTDSVTGTAISNSLGRMSIGTTSINPNNSTRTTAELFSYADNGQLVDLYQMTPNSGGYLHTTASYFEDGQLNTLSGVPGLAESWTYGLDAFARIGQVSDNTGAIVSGMSYNADGTISGVTYMNGSDSYGYDAAGRMNAFSYSVAGKIYSGNVTWNQNGTLGTMQINDAFHPTTDNQTCNYSYDDLARLTNDNCGTYGSQTYSYDSFGNISKTANGLGVSFTALYVNSPQNNRVTNMNFVYDANGNITNDGLGNAYTYDPNWQKITSSNGTSITYDAFGQAVEIGTSPVLYSPVGKLGVLAIGGTWGTGAEVRLPTPAGAFQYDKGATNAHVNHPDWLGSNRFVSIPNTNAAAGGVSYTPFGESNWSIGSNVRIDFTGQDQDLGPASTYDFPARKYSAVQGRWLSPDPTLGNLGDPQTLNKYAYMRGNPLNGTDPSGLCPKEGDSNYDPNCVDLQISNQDTVSGEQSPTTATITTCYLGCVDPGQGADLSSSTDLSSLQIVGTGLSGSDQAIPGESLGNGDVAAGSIAQGVFNGPGMSTLWNSANSWGEAAFYGTGVALALPATVAAGPTVAGVARAGVGAAANTVGYGIGYAQGALAGGSGVLLGKWISSSENYIIDAQEMGLSYFNIGNFGWKVLNTLGNPLVANQGFLDKVVQRGLPIFLGSQPVAAGGTYEWELQYLFEKGMPNGGLIPVW